MTPDQFKQIEQAEASSPELNAMIANALSKYRPLNYMGSLDDAMSSLPNTMVNLVIYQFGTFWAAGFNDTSQKLGMSAATKRIERMKLHFGGDFKLNAEPWLEMEKAISEHWLEFKCRYAKTLNGAIVSAALRARFGISSNLEFDEETL